VATITLTNAGTYLVWGEAAVVAVNEADQSFAEMTSDGCYLTGQSVEDFGSGALNSYGGTISVHSVVVAPTAGETVTLNCDYGGLVNTSINAEAGAFSPVLSAIQVQ
jgi:hypothetical protein